MAPSLSVTPPVSGGVTVREGRVKEETCKNSSCILTLNISWMTPLSFTQFLPAKRDSEIQLNSYETLIQNMWPWINMLNRHCRFGVRWRSDGSIHLTSSSRYWGNMSMCACAYGCILPSCSILFLLLCLPKLLRVFVWKCTIAHNPFCVYDVCANEAPVTLQTYSLHLLCCKQRSRHSIIRLPAFRPARSMLVINMLPLLG